MGDSYGKLRNRSRLIVATVFFCCAGGGSNAQAPVVSSSPTTKTMLVEPPAPLLPQHFGAWEQAGNSGMDGSPAAGMDAATEAVMTEDGLVRFASATYGRKGSSDTIELKAFQLVDASGAYSAYRYELQPQDRPLHDATLGDEAAGDSRGVLFRSGGTVIDASFHGTVRPGELAGLVPGLPKLMGPKSALPLLPSVLPAKGFDADTVRYALGPTSYAAMGGVLPPDVVGFDKSAETLTAKAKSGGVLTLVLYPTPEIAGEHLRMMEQAMKQQGVSAGTVVLRREGTLVAMTSGAWKADAAQAMVNDIHLHTEVTFDKPMPVEFHAEVRKTYSLLMNVVIFSAMAFLAAIVLALFFGGGRALIRVMQGKPAATEPEFLRIDLREAGATRLGERKG